MVPKKSGVTVIHNEKNDGSPREQLMVGECVLTIGS